ncbi:MAG TPA: hypothetical protein V6D07_18905 [Trichocoleus sp.]
MERFAAIAENLSRNAIAQIDIVQGVDFAVEGIRDLTVVVSIDAERIVELYRQALDKSYEVALGLAPECLENIRAAYRIASDSMYGFANTLRAALEPEEESERRECFSCANYCGQVFNGVPLVCAIHPYGPPKEDWVCSDWRWG